MGTSTSTTGPWLRWRGSARACEGCSLRGEERVPGPQLRGAGPRRGAPRRRRERPRLRGKLAARRGGSFRAWAGARAPARDACLVQARALLEGAGAPLASRDARFETRTARFERARATPASRAVRLASRRPRLHPVASRFEATGAPLASRAVHAPPSLRPPASWRSNPLTRGTRRVRARRRACRRLARDRARSRAARSASRGRADRTWRGARGRGRRCACGRTTRAGRAQ
jgi:hypothetical protein